MALQHDIELEVEQGISRFTLNKSATHNALTLDMLRALDAGLAQLEAREDIRCIVFSSTSERFFCSGADIKEWGDIDPEKMGSLFIRAGNRVFRRIREMDVATIAVMSGHALRGGLELALACDFRCAAEGIKLGLPEASLGAIPGWLGAQRLYALAGAGRMHHLVMLGETITAQQALEWGIVQAVVAGVQLDAYVRGICARLSSRSPAALAVGKRLMRMIEPPALDVAHELAASVCKGTADAREGVAAFREKRPADFGCDRELAPPPARYRAE
ncbi:enoyl-CoA hydratase [Sodalis sp. TME1]|nr:enoyl-CoA hydratase [Sodalis sp. TME1]